MKRTQSQKLELTSANYTDAVVALIRAEPSTPPSQLAADIERQALGTTR